MNLTTVIKEYIECTKKVCSFIKSTYMTNDILRAVRDGRIPSRGVIPDHQIQISFHGIGCLAESVEFSIDFDFLPDGNPGGFDAFRLSVFKSERLGDLSQFSDMQKVQKELDILESNKIVQKVSIRPSSSMYFLRDDQSTE